MSVQIFSVFIIQSWLVGRSCDSRNLFVLSRLSHLLANSCSSILIILFIPIKLDIIASLLFLLLVI